MQKTVKVFLKVFFPSFKNIILQVILKLQEQNKPCVKKQCLIVFFTVKSVKPFQI